MNVWARQVVPEEKWLHSSVIPPDGLLSSAGTPQEKDYVLSEALLSAVAPVRCLIAETLPLINYVTPSPPARPCVLPYVALPCVLLLCLLSRAVFFVFVCAFLRTSSRLTGRPLKKRRHDPRTKFVLRRSSENLFFLFFLFFFLFFLQPCVPYVSGMRGCRVVYAKNRTPAKGRKSVFPAVVVVFNVIWTRDCVRLICGQRFIFCVFFAVRAGKWRCRILRFYSISPEVRRGWISLLGLLVCLIIVVLRLAKLSGVFAGAFFHSFCSVRLV